MSTATADKSQAPVRMDPAREFRLRNTQIATSLLKDWVGEEKAQEAAGRVAAALSASAASARDPSDFYACTPQSIGTSIAIAALTDIMPGVGATALAYVVPQRARRGEAPQLQYMLSHRGLNALARRCGQTMIAIPIGTHDQLQSDSDGDVRIVQRDIDNPPVKLADLRGVMVIVKELQSGAVLFRGWVPRVLIEQRRQMSRSANSEFSPWHNWPVEMAMKTAMHYAISRGWCVIDDTSAAKALSVEAAADLPALPAPSGPATVNDLADMVVGVQPAPAQEFDADEPAHELDISFRPDEKAADWSTRVLKVIGTCTTMPELEALNSQLTELLENEQITTKRHGDMLEAINRQAATLPVEA